MLKKRVRFLLILLLLNVSLPLLYVEAHIHSQKHRKSNEYRVSLETWLLALTSATLIGCCGIFPLLFNRWINLDKLNQESTTMQVVLSFAVGGLLGDVWLHLIPEAWGSNREDSLSHLRVTGLWVITGLFIFMSVERFAKCLSASDDDDDKQGIVSSPYQVSGYLNLLANCTDNFTHGLAVAASYMVSPLVGILTTLAIICHEIPHEIGDFAILLRSGFTCPDAARAQLVTASGGMFGVVLGLLAEHIGHCTYWMLPFTGGGFLYIALVSIVPELNEMKGAEMKQIISVLSGVTIMAAVTIIERKSCSMVPVS